MQHRVISANDAISVQLPTSELVGVVEVVSRKTSKSQTSDSVFVETPTGAVVKLRTTDVHTGAPRAQNFTLEGMSSYALGIQSTITSTWGFLGRKEVCSRVSVEKRNDFEKRLKTVSTELLDKTVKTMLSDMCSILDENRNRKRRKSTFPMKRWTEEEEAVLIDTYATLVQQGHHRTADILEHLSARLKRSTKAVDLRMQALRKECRLLPYNGDPESYGNYQFPKSRKTKSEIDAGNFMKRWSVDEDKVLIGFYNRCKANKLKFSSEVSKIANVLDRTDNSVCLRVIGLKKKYPDLFVRKGFESASPPALVKLPQLAVSPDGRPGLVGEDEGGSLSASATSFDFNLGSGSPVSHELFKNYADLMKSPIAPEEGHSNRRGTTWKKWTEAEEELLVNAINLKPYTVSTSTVMKTVSDQIGRSTMATTLRLNYLRRKKPQLFKTKRLSRAHVKDEVYNVISDLLCQLEGKQKFGDGLGQSSKQDQLPAKRSRFDEEIDLADYESWLNKQKEAVQFSHVFPLIPASNWGKINNLDTPTF